MKIKILYEDTDPSTDTSWKLKNDLDHREMMATALYIATNKNKNYNDVIKLLYAEPRYAKLIYDNAGGIDKIILDLINPISIQHIAKTVNYNPEGLIFSWIKRSADKKIGTLGIQFLMLYYIHKFKTGKALELEEVKRNPSGAYRLYNQYGAYNGILKYLSSPEAVSELARESSDFAIEYVKRVISLLPGKKF